MSKGEWLRCKLISGRLRLTLRWTVGQELPRPCLDVEERKVSLGMRYTMLIATPPCFACMAQLVLPLPRTHTHTYTVLHARTHTHTTHTHRVTHAHTMSHTRTHTHTHTHREQATEAQSQRHAHTCIHRQAHTDFGVLINKAAVGSLC